jgi:hypothetical protein
VQRIFVRFMGADSRSLARTGVRLALQKFDLGVAAADYRIIRDEDFLVNFGADSCGAAS